MMRQGLDPEDAAEGAIAEAVLCPICKPQEPGKTAINVGKVDVSPTTPHSVKVRLMCIQGHRFTLRIDPTASGEVLLSLDFRRRSAKPPAKS